MHLQWSVLLRRLLLLALGLPVLAAAAAAHSEPVLPIMRALLVEKQARGGEVELVGKDVDLPHVWTDEAAGFEGRMRYRIPLPAPDLSGDTLPALYIERACSAARIRLNGGLVASSGPIEPPYTRNCYHPQLVTLPPGLLRAEGNMLEIELAGPALQRVAARQRAGGLSELRVGPYPVLLPMYEQQLFWNVTMSQIASITTTLTGLLMLSLAWTRRREPVCPAYLYFGLTLLGWSLVSAPLWLRELPFALTPTQVEVLTCALFPPVVLCAVLFLMRYAGARRRGVDALLVLQCVVVPLSFLAAGGERMFALANAWYLVYALEVLAATVFYLVQAWRQQRSDFPLMALALGLLAILVVGELGVQQGWIDLPRIHPLHAGMPLLFIAVGTRLVQLFLRALRAAEQARRDLEQRVAEKTAEIERSYAELADVRVEQVAEAERKRIAADLHDDLGAKLLTIVHTSGDERIATLAREALEEMRLSVRGLTGKPVKIADALADWRAENVSRLGQANVQLDWVSCNDNDERALSARAYVQTTRILREAVNNIIKHSGADAVSIRCEADDTDFSLMIRDNGRGIPLEVDGRLDRGHGMASMKRRAKQLAGQCLVESSAGQGTVLRLTLPL